MKDRKGPAARLGARTSLVLATLLSCVFFASYAEEVQLKIPFLDDWGNTLSKAQEDDRLVMVEFYTAWCTFCDEFERDTLGDPRVVELSREFVFARLDADVQKAAANRYRPDGYPTVVFATPSGEEIVRVNGFREADPFFAVMRMVTERGREIADLLAASEANPKDFAPREALGSIYLDLGLGSKATEHLRAALKAKNLDAEDEARIQFHLARATVADKNYRKAVKILTKLIESDPSGERAPSYHLELARAYEASGKSSRAEEIYSEIARRFPGTPEADIVAGNR